MITTEQLQKLPLSDDTARLLSCISRMQDIREEVYATLSHLYCSEQRAADVMNEAFVPAYDKLEEIIQSHVMQSIMDKLCAYEAKEI